MFLFLSPVPQLFCSMSATFTLNFFRSGIQFGSWGAFQLPGLLNFGEFKVCFALPPRISSSTRDSRSLVRHQREVIGSVGTASGGGIRAPLVSCACGPLGAALALTEGRSLSCLFSALSLPVLMGTVVFCLSLPYPFSQCADSDKKCHLWTAMDLGFFIVMGVIGGLLGATFNCLNKRLAKYRMRNVHPKPKLVRYPCAPRGPAPPGEAILRADAASHASSIPHLRPGV